MAPNDSFTLRISKAGATIRESRFEQESLILGSGAGAAIRLDDPCVSTLHVMLKREKDGITAIDLGSEHGTRLGENLIRQPVALNHGDTLKLGSFEVKVLFGSQEPPEIADFTAGLFQPPAKSITHRPRSNRTSEAAVALKAKVERVNPAAPQMQVETPGQKSAWKLISRPLPKEARPTQDARVLQVSLLWGEQLLEVEHFPDGEAVEIGDARGNAFAVFSPGIGSRFPLARAENGKVALKVPPGAGLTVWSGEESLSAEALRARGRLVETNGSAELTLELEERARVQIDRVGLLVRQVRPPLQAKVRTWEKAELAYLAIAALTVLTLIGSVTYLGFRPVQDVEPDNSNLASKTYVQFLAHKLPPVKIPKRASGVKEGAKAKEDEGKMGKAEAKQEKAAPSRRGTQTVDPKKKVDERKKVMASGLLGALKKGGAVADVFGPGGLGTGINAALGGLKGGAAVGDAHGIGGLGSRGTGTGAGGTGLGIGGLGTKGMGHGAGGYGSIDLGGRGKQMTRIIPGKTTVVGGLSREVIERVIRQHQSEIKYCYEIELNQHPDLAGKVGVVFIISGSGSVSEANVAETTLNDSVTEQCMLQKIRRWRFPQPAGGGIVTVTFPWIFKPAGN